MATHRSIVPKRRSSGVARKAPVSSHPPGLNYIERMPIEIVLKIVSYLEASTLFCLLHINKHFYKLAMDNALWCKLYEADFNKNRKRKTINMLRSTAEGRCGDLPEGYWKNKYFHNLGSRDLKTWERKLSHISRHTGLPCQMETVLRTPQVTWEVTVSEKCGKQTRFNLSRFKYFETCLMLTWDVGRWPELSQIATLQLQRVRSTRMKCKGLKTPSWRTLIATLDMVALTQNMQFIAKDEHVELELLQPGFILAFWKGQTSIAFLMVSLHFQRLFGNIRRSTRRFVAKPRFSSYLEEIDRFNKGFHDVQIHFSLHTNATNIMNETFKWIVFDKDHQDCVKLRLIQSKDKLEHITLSDKLILNWKSEVIRGTVKDCCIMSLTILDSCLHELWCVASPVTMTPMPTHFSYEQCYEVHYKESDDRVEMVLGLADGSNQLHCISLEIYLSSRTVYNHFKTNY